MKPAGHIPTRAVCVILALAVSPAVMAATNATMLIGLGQPRMILTGEIKQRDAKTVTVASSLGERTVARTNILFMMPAASQPSGGYVPPPAPATAPAIASAVEPGTSPSRAAAPSTPTASADTNQEPFMLYVVNGIVFTNKEGAKALGDLPELSSLVINCASNPPGNLGEYTNWLASAEKPNGFTEWYYLPEKNQLESFLLPDPPASARAATWAELKTFLLGYTKAMGHSIVPETFESRHFARELMATAHEQGFQASLFQYGRPKDIYSCVMFPTADSGNVIVDVGRPSPEVEWRGYAIMHVVSGQPTQAWPLVFARNLTQLPPPEERGRNGNGMVYPEETAQGGRVIPPL